MASSRTRTIIRLRADQLELCYYCGNEFIDGTEREPTLDHRIPKSRGGRRGTNLVCACARCNRIKGNLTEEEYWAAYKLAHDHGLTAVGCDRNWAGRERQYREAFNKKLIGTLKRYQAEHLKRKKARAAAGWTPIPWPPKVRDAAPSRQDSMWARYVAADAAKTRAERERIQTGTRTAGVRQSGGLDAPGSTPGFPTNSLGMA